MTIQTLIQDITNSLTQVKERFENNLKSIRSGRANASILDNVMVEAYDTKMPLKQVGNVVVMEAQLIQITPFDPNNLNAISTAIRNSSELGLNPADDGKVVRVPIPPLTEERRQELSKQIGQKQEETMISIRNIRHDAIDLINTNKKDKNIGEDEAKRLISQVEEKVNKIKSEIENLSKTKENEIMTL
ncbi:MAG TPA: ribosome recycling factor [Patescibacteria group bacterium]|nr:ribosome recycling factor [Patescibacteria group bacterium]